MSHRRLHLGPTAPSTRTHLDQDDHLIPGVQVLLGLPADLLPCFGEPAHEHREPFEAAIDLPEVEACDRAGILGEVDLEIRIEESGRGLDVARVERLVAAPDDLDVVAQGLPPLSDAGRSIVP
jgi:hypothetical protein